MNTYIARTVGTLSRLKIKLKSFGPQRNEKKRKTKRKRRRQNLFYHVTSKDTNGTKEGKGAFLFYQTLKRSHRWNKKEQKEKKSKKEGNSFVRSSVCLWLWSCVRVLSTSLWNICSNQSCRGNLTILTTLQRLHFAQEKTNTQ